VGGHESLSHRCLPLIEGRHASRVRHGGRLGDGWGRSSPRILASWRDDGRLEGTGAIGIRLMDLCEERNPLELSSSIGGVDDAAVWQREGGIDSQRGLELLSERELLSHTLHRVVQNDATDCPFEAIQWLGLVVLPRLQLQRIFE
jgi:hypothetical protein